MKKLLFILLAFFAAVSCDYSEFSDRLDNLESRVEALEKLCDRLNQDIVSIRSLVEVLQQGDYITDIQPVVENGETVGYTIVFAKSGSITLYHGRDGEKGDPGDKGDPGEPGADGSTPVVGVKKDSDGIYYWTLNGEWLLDEDGNRIPATGRDGADGEDGQDGQDGQNGQDGITPLLKIEDGYWYISYDEGATWTLLGKATGEDGADGQNGADGQDGDSFFSDVIVGDTHVTVVLRDGTSFTIPLAPRTSIAFDLEGEEAPVVVPGSAVSIRYTLTDATESTQVSASSDGYYKVRVEKEDNSRGILHVETPAPYTDGFITVHVSDGSSFSFSRVINFYEGQMQFPGGREYAVPSRGGEVTVDLKYNFAYTAEVEPAARKWITLQPGTKAAMESGSIAFSVAANTAMATRSGRILIYGPDRECYTELTVRQASTVFSIGQDRFVAAAEGETLSTTLTSSLGVQAVPADGAGWLTVSVDPESGDNYRFTAVAAANESTELRRTEVTLLDAAGTHTLGTVSVCQLPAAGDRDRAMVFEVRANYSNDFTAYLPVKGGKIDACVDWGDGNVEYYTSSGDREWIAHRYPAEVPATYTVTVTGTLTELNSSQIPAHSVTRVVQWGKTGLTSMYYAFVGNRYLTEIPDDTAGSFSGVTDFSSAFKDCIGLTAVPEGLFAYCVAEKARYTSYLSETFSGCTALTALPENLFPQSVRITGFESTFAGCTGLTALPGDLFADCPEAVRFYRTFSGCTGLTTLPAGLFAGNAAASDFSETFGRCSGLTEIPSELFANCPEAVNFHATFYGCTALTAIPETLFAACTKVGGGDKSAFSRTFADCKALRSIPEDLFVNCPDATVFSGLFSGCKSLTSIPEGLFRNNPLAEAFDNVFNECSGLTSVPAGLFDRNRRIKELAGAFYGCGNIQGESPYTVIDGVKYHLYDRYRNPDQFVMPVTHNMCFFNCLKMTDYPYVPLEWK